jgi:hypothetical protein
VFCEGWTARFRYIRRNPSTNSGKGSDAYQRAVEFGRRSRSHDLSWTRNGTDRESLELTRTVITPDVRPGKWLEAVVQNDGPLPGQSNARRHEPVSQAHSRWIVGDLGLPGKQNFPD